MYTVRELKPDEGEKWDAFIAKSPQGSLFHRLEWNRMLVETDPHLDGFLPLVCVDKNDQFLAGLTIPYRLDSSRRLACPPFFGYVTSLLADSLRYVERRHTYASYSALVDLANGLAARIESACLRNSPDFWDIRAFMFLEWKIQTVYTHELTFADNAWEKVSPDLQKIIQAGQGKYSLKPAVSDEFDETFAARNLQIEAGVLKPRLAWMRTTETGRLFALTDPQGRPVALTLAVLSQPDRRAYLWGTACVEGDDSTILPVLFWQVCAALAADYPRLDLGYSANIQLSQAKDRLGGRLLPTFVTSYSAGSKKPSGRSDAADGE